MGRADKNKKMHFWDRLYFREEIPNPMLTRWESRLAGTLERRIIGQLYDVPGQPSAALDITKCYVWLF